MRLIAFSILVLAGSVLANSGRGGGGWLIFFGICLGFVELWITGFWKEAWKRSGSLDPENVPLSSKKGEDN